MIIRRKQHPQIPQSKEIPSIFREWLGRGLLWSTIALGRPPPSLVKAMVLLLLLGKM